MANVPKAVLRGASDLLNHIFYQSQGLATKGAINGDAIPCESYATRCQEAITMQVCCQEAMVEAAITYVTLAEHQRTSLRWCSRTGVRS